MEHTSPRTRRAFSLLEMMLVLVIIGTLTTIVVVNLVGRQDRANRSTTLMSMRQIEDALKDYSFQNAAFPTSVEGLGILVPDYLVRVPQDAWKNEFVYVSPTDDPNIPYDIICVGKDKEFGTADDIVLSEATQKGS